MRRSAFPLVVATILSVAGHAYGQPNTTKTIVLTDIQAARFLILNGKLDEAKKLAQQYLLASPEDQEMLFLLGTIAVEQKDYDTAISLFRRILGGDPETERVRLELARAFFLKGDYDNAERQFRFARAGNVDDAVKSNIDHFLSEIYRLRTWTINLSLALAPDSNQNAATSANQISLYGLPFTLEKSARRQSGIGLAGNLGAEWSPLLNDTIKARLGANFSRSEYGGGGFDDMTISAYGGPQFLFFNWDVSMLATGFQRWFANRDYVSGVGGKLGADYGITSDWLINASVGGQSIVNAISPEQSGPLWSAQTQITYIWSPSTLVQLQLGFNRQDAKNAAYSYSSLWFASGYQQDLAFGFSAGFQPGYFVTQYDAALAAFDKIRSDDTVVLAFTLLNRRLDYHGFTPRFSYVFTEQHSNLALYSFTRNQFQIGVTSLF